MTQRLTCVAIVVALGGIAFAGPHDFVIEHAGVGGTAEQAQPYIQKFLEYTEQALAWPKGSATGVFFPEPGTDLEKYLAEKKPGFGMLDPDQVLELQSKKVELELLDTVVGKNQSLGHLHIVVKDPTLKDLAALKGKTVASSHLQSVKFLSRIVFDGKIDAATYFKALDKKLSMLKAIKAVNDGSADAALISDEDAAWLRTSAYVGSIRIVWTSPELPPMQMIAFVKHSMAKDREALGKMLLGMCADANGKAVCDALDIQKFGPPDQKAYDAAMKKYGVGGKPK